MKDLSKVVLDDSPSDFAIRLCSVFYSLLSHVIEGHNVVEHTHCLVEWTVAVVVGVGVLLEEVILDQLGHLQCDLVSFSQ